MRLCCTAAIVLTWCYAASAPARNIYVDNLGGDNHLDGSFARAVSTSSGPVRTIGKALKLAMPSDRIVLANTSVPYRESITLQCERWSGAFSQPLEIDGNGAILDGSIPVPADDTWQHVSGDTFRFQPKRMAFQQLFIAGRPVTRLQPAMVSELKPLEWCLLEGWIYFRTEPTKLPQAYALACAGDPAGITLYKVHNVVIRNLIVQGFQLDGINAHDGVRRARLVNVTCRGNGRSGVCVANGSRLELDGCTLGDNGAGQLWLEGYSSTQVFNSQLIPNTAPDIVRQGGALHVDGVIIP
jgi:hypothetical protein